MSEVEIDDMGVVKLTGEIDIFSVEALQQRLLAITPDEFPEITLDLSGVTELDTAGLQLLWAFRSGFASFRVRACSGELRGFIEKLGFEKLFI